jgi:divalent metal cation (Fe/Co/Zn/Cd) transporter
VLAPLIVHTPGVNSTGKVTLGGLMDATTTSDKSNILKAVYDLVKCTVFSIPDVKLTHDEEAVIDDVLNQHSSELVKHHELRVWKAGHRLHIEMHLTVPEHMTLRNAHNLRRTIIDKIKNHLDHNLVVHIEPCCRECSVCKEKWSQQQLPKHREEGLVPNLVGKEIEKKAGCPYEFWNLSL